MEKELIKIIKDKEGNIDYEYNDEENDFIVENKIYVVGLIEKIKGEVLNNEEVETIDDEEEVDDEELDDEEEVDEDEE